MADMDRKQKLEAERTGRVPEVTGEMRSFKKGDPEKAHDPKGAAGDPVEGERGKGGDAYPA